MIITISNLQQAKNQIYIAKEKPIIVKAQNVEFNRKILEYGKFQILLSPELSQDVKKDGLKQINSGLNHVLAGIAAKNNIAIGIDLQSLSQREKKQKAILMPKIKQNIKLCRKANCKLVLLNYKDKKDAFSFLISLEASTKQAKEAIYSN